jgi:hypothetical protein
MFAGLTLWSFLLSCPIGFVIGVGGSIYSRLNPEEWRVKNPPEWAFVDSTAYLDMYIGTKTVSKGADGSLSAVIKFVPRDTEAGKKKKKEMIDMLTAEVGESQASSFSFVLDTVEFQCSANTSVFRREILCDWQGNIIHTEDYEPYTPEESGLFTTGHSLQKAACYLAQRMK